MIFKHPESSNCRNFSTILRQYLTKKWTNEEKFQPHKVHGCLIYIHTYVLHYYIRSMDAMMVQARLNENFPFFRKISLCVSRLDKSSKAIKITVKQIWCLKICANKLIYLSYVLHTSSFIPSGQKEKNLKRLSRSFEVLIHLEKSSLWILWTRKPQRFAKSEIPKVIHISPTIPSSGLSCLTATYLCANIFIFSIIWSKSGLFGKF